MATPATSGTDLPRWETASIFPSLSSRSFVEARELIGADLARLTALYDQHDVRGGPPGVPGAEQLVAFETVTAATNRFLESVRSLSAYLSALVSTDSDDDEAAAQYSGLQAELAGLQRLTVRFEAWIGRYGAEPFISATESGAAHAHALRQAEATARHQMTEEAEGLYADLRLTGGSAWNKLYGDVTARLTGTLDGETLPITVLRGMATDADGQRRRRAYQAELAAWQSAGVALAACMNAIKGEANTVNARRGWSDALAPSLHANAVERTTLEAMQAAARSAFPDFRRFLRAKARLLGHDGGLPWWDLFAPVPGEPAVSWAEAAGAVEEAFGTYDASLAALARRAITGGWVDAEPRRGKRGGAFCMAVRGEESRILLNFDGSVDSVQTLAHELGHAYHNSVLSNRTALQRRTPMALAETASIFCETIMVQAGLEGADDHRRLLLLNVDLQGACQVVVDIHSRFLFEREVFDRRRRSTLSVSELNALMTEAQLATYGDGLDPEALHPWMWAVKPHYYSTAFYNWPYCFGLLFGIGLYARYSADPDRFRAGYDDLLSSSGMATAAELAGRFGIDITTEAFWQASLDVLRTRIDDFVALADARSSG